VLGLSPCRPWRPWLGAGPESLGSGLSPWGSCWVAYQGCHARLRAKKNRLATYSEMPCHACDEQIVSHVIS